MKKVGSGSGSRVLVGTLVAGAVVAGSKILLDKFWKVRDPTRATPQDQELMYSPADGLVTHIRRIENGRIRSDLLNEDLGLEELTGLEHGPDVEGWLIGIYVGLLDVRFTVAPVSSTLASSVDVPAKAKEELLGPLERVQLLAGQIPDLVGRHAQLESGKLTLTLEGEALKVILVHHLLEDTDVKMLVSSGESVQAGQKLCFLEREGLVELVLLREDLEILLSVGDRVQAGVSELARV